MRRRAFIGFLGGAAAWPLIARGQQPVPVVGYVRSTTAHGFTHLEAAFRQGLKEAGFVEGQNVAIEYRYADNQLDRLPPMIAELIRRPVSVIAGNTLAARAAKAATATVPIVFVGGGDPVRRGLVARLNRPGGNVTGALFFGPDLGSKRLELLHQLVPTATRIAALLNLQTTETERSDVLAAAQAMSLQLLVLGVDSVRDIEAAFAPVTQSGAGALFVGAGAFMNSQRERVAALAARHKVPAIYAWRNAVVAGGLMSYGASQSDAYWQGGIYVGRILAGEKPGDLPVFRSTKFELVLNLKTAKALGLDIPPAVLALADEVIE